MRNEAVDHGLPETAEAIAEIQRGQRAGRQLVPLLGAGISVESGYPPTRSIVDYLAAVNYYFKAKLYLPQPVLSEEEQSDDRGVYDWSTHLRLFGWPDRFKLTEQLWNHFTTNDPADAVPSTPTRRRLWLATKQILRREWAQRGNDTPERLQGLRTFLLEHKSDVEGWIKATPTSADARGPADVAARLLNDPEAAEVEVAWRDLLRSVTDSDHNNVDSLFQSFNRGRQPGTSHRFIAFLTRLLRCNLVLSINFDDLIELAFQSEKLRHRVFDIWQGAALPDASLLRERLSLVKLHGGAYGLRVGESLDDPLGEVEKAHLIRYLPPEPMLLVLGYAGADRRIMDFVRAFLDDRSKRRGDAAASLADVAWIHFEPKEALRKSVKNLEAEFGDKAFRTWRTHDVGGFLAGLYARLTAVHPTTTSFYEPIFHRPAGVDLSWFLGGGQGSARVEAQPGPNVPVHLFSPRHPGGRGADCCSIAMSDFAARNGATHQTLWIDLGTLPSVEIVVAEIIRQCRRYDSDLPPVLLALEPASTQAERYANCQKAVGRVHEALKRGHYVLVLDNIGAFGRPPTSHHGIATSCARAVGDEIRLLASFLRRLVEELDLANDSYICLSTTDLTARFNRRRPRAVELEDKSDPFDMIRRELGELTDDFTRLAAERKDLIRLDTVHNRPGSESEFDDVVDSIWAQLKKRSPWDDPAWSAPAPHPISPPEGKAEERGRRAVADVLCLLSCFRRPRSLVALSSLCEPFIRRTDEGESRGEGADAQDPLATLLDLLHEQRILVRQEGEIYRMPRGLRDAIYEACSDAATGRQLLEEVGATDDVFTLYDHSSPGRNGIPRLPLPVLLRDVARLTYLHRSIARYYYTELYLASRDVSSFFEYLYHRISSVRYGTSLAALVCLRYNEFRAASWYPARAGSGDQAHPDPVIGFIDKLLQERKSAQLERYYDLRASRWP